MQCSDMSKTTKNELLGVGNGVVGTKTSALALIVSKLHHFTHFGGHFGPPGGSIWDMQCSGMSKTTKNALLGVGNGAVGTKTSSLALIVSKLHHFTHFYPFWGPFWSPRGQIWGNRFLERSESGSIVFAMYENMGIDTKFTMLRWIVIKLQPKTLFFGASKIDQNCFWGPILDPRGTWPS